MRILSTIIISMLVMVSCSQNQSVGQVVLTPTDYKAKIDALTDTQIIEVDNFIKRINTPIREWDLKSHAEKIVDERKDLLNKLAK